MKYTLNKKFFLGLAIVVASLAILFGGSVSSVYSAIGGSLLTDKYYTDIYGSDCPDGYTSEGLDVANFDDDGSDRTGTQTACFGDTSGSGSGGSGGTSASVTLTASPTTIDQGESTELTWSGQGLEDNSCDGGGFSTGGGATSGSDNITLYDDANFSITCNAVGGGTVSDNAMVTVNSVVTSGESDNGGGSGGTGDGENGDGESGVGNGGEGEGSGSGSGDGGDGSLTLEAEPSLVTRGSQTTLNWSAEDASECVITATDFDSGVLSGQQGQVQTNIINNTTKYTLLCIDDDGLPVSVSDTVNIVPRFQEQ